MQLDMPAARRGRFSILLVGALTLLMALGAMGVYLRGTLMGDFNHFFLSAKMFGVPEDLRARGITPLYTGEKETGWDGQFYYYIANDLLAQKDTPQHVDSHAYRYQRIGLPLLAHIVSRLTLQSWVSPAVYYLTELALVLAATMAAAWYFRRHGVSPYLALAWSLGMGTQVTLLNALPDAAADALLILALIAFLERRLWLYFPAIIFAALAREAYVLLPVLLIAVDTFIALRRERWHLLAPRQLAAFIVREAVHIVPTLIFCGWHLFVRLRFHTAPSDQAAGILGPPFWDAFRYMMSGIRNQHLLVGSGVMARFEALGIALFFALLLISGYYLTKLIVRDWQRIDTDGTAGRLGVAAFFGALTLMYCCFGYTVMMHHTGYFKAANIFMFAVPLCAQLSQARIGRAVMLFLAAVTLFFDFALWYRVGAPPSFGQYTMPAQVEYAATEPACLKHFQAGIKLLGSKEIVPTGGWAGLLMRRTAVMRVALTNTGDEVFYPYQGPHAVNMSYHWLDKDRQVVRDGIRTSLPHALMPGATIETQVVVQFPRQAGDYILRLTPVQEGCAWFYNANPTSALDLPYHLP